MLTALLTAGASFILCWLLTPVAGALACRWGLVDQPDARRKLHSRPIPVAGGVAVFLSISIAVGGAFLIADTLDEELTADFPLVGLLCASALICGLGVLDDCGCLRGRQKLAGQVLAVGIVMACGVRMHTLDLFGWQLELGLLAYPFTLLWLLGAINSLNLLDGMDGMLGCVGCIIAVAMVAMAVLGGHWAAACVAAAVAGALLGFLRHNFPPATIFMGDAGSMLTGLIVGVLGIQSSLKAPATVTLIAPLAMLTIPFLDTGAAFIRRKLTGRSIYSTDRGHLHHCLLQRGFSVRGALGLVSLFCFVTVFGALVSLALKNEMVAICTTLAVIGVMVVTRSFGYAEFLLLRGHLGRLVASFFRLPGQGQVRQTEVHLHGTACWKTLMETLKVRAFILNLQTLRVDISIPALHEEYHSHWQRFDEQLEETLWRAELPLVIGARNVGRLLVSGYTDVEPLWAKVAELTRIIESFSRAVSPAAGASDQSLQRVLPMWWDDRTEFVVGGLQEVDAAPAPDEVLVHPAHVLPGRAHREHSTPLAS